MTSDTHPQIEAMRLDLFRETPPWRKAHMLGQMYQTSKQLAMVGLRSRYPDASEAELRFRLAVLLLGVEIAESVYGLENEIEELDVD